MPLLFLLPTIFMGAFLETARTANEDILRTLANGAKPKQQVDAEAHIELLNHTVALGRASRRLGGW
jgi:hypothetical protein